MFLLGALGLFPANSRAPGQMKEFLEERDGGKIFKGVEGGVASESETGKRPVRLTGL